MFVEETWTRFITDFRRGTARALSATPVEKAQGGVLLGWTLVPHNPVRILLVGHRMDDQGYEVNFVRLGPLYR